MENDDAIEDEQYSLYIKTLCGNCGLYKMCKTRISISEECMDPVTLSYTCSSCLEKEEK
jgi:hypothetical protein